MKDVELRIRCLEAVAVSTAKFGLTSQNMVERAQDLYDWCMDSDEAREEAKNRRFWEQMKYCA